MMLVKSNLDDKWFLDTHGNHGEVAFQVDPNEVEGDSLMYCAEWGLGSRADEFGAVLTVEPDYDS